MAATNDNQDLQRAYALHQNGDLKQAAALYRELIRRNANNFQALHLLGLVEASLGNFEHAKSFMARSLPIRPPNIQFVENYAAILFQTADYTAALDACQRGLQLNDRSAALSYLKAISLFKLDRLEEALAQFDKVLSSQPDNPAALNERGSVFAALKRYDAALASVERAIAIAPSQPEAHLNKGNLCSELQRHPDAVAAYEKALALKPGLAEAWLGLGNVYRATTRFDDALAAYDKAQALGAALSSVWLGRGNVFQNTGRYDDALAAYDKAIALKADFAEVWYGRGGVFSDQQRYDKALEAYDKALALKPDIAEAWLGRGNILKNLRRYDEAFAAFDNALALKADLVEAWVNRGGAYVETNRPHEALAEFDKALSIKPNFPEAVSGRIFTLDLAGDVGFEEHQKAREYWWRRIGSPIAERSRMRHANERDPCRRIRVGYVSADFRKHSAALSFRPILTNHDKTQFEITCYSSTPTEDEFTAEFRRAADRWRDIIRSSDDELARRIEADQIDILVDLSAHSAGNRLGVFARKPAPIQVTAWGHAGGTGLPMIDYLFSDPVACPEAARRFFAEKIFDLPCFITIDRPVDLPAPAEPPVLANGYVTFGVFNRASKISDEVVALWARILGSVPLSRILMKHGGFDVDSTRTRLLQDFAAHRISADRIAFLGNTSRQDHLAAFGKIDISLDPFPMNGGISTWESLQMGVPVIAKLGNFINSRAGGAIVTAVGLGDWVAETADGYLAVAEKYASMPEHLQNLRAALPAMISASPAGNSAKYTKAVEAAYRKMWTDYCEGA
jgi:predicted O-linked N-acetylglucosamine transferase (SPINDLY family)